MAEKIPQTYANHTRFDPLFHFVLIPVLALLLLGGVYAVWRAPDLTTAILLALIAATLLTAFKVRLYALKVQDRVIRIEETLRLERLLAEPLRSRIGDLSVKQLVALRFASDAEIPGLVARALD